MQLSLSTGLLFITQTLTECSPAPPFHCLFFPFSPADLAGTDSWALNCLLGALALPPHSEVPVTSHRGPFPGCHLRQLHTCTCLLLWAHRCHPRGPACHSCSVGNSMGQRDEVSTLDEFCRQAQKAESQKARSCLKDSEAGPIPMSACSF